MKKSTLFWAAALASLCASSAMASCYVVYDAAHKVVYRSVQPPVDLSYTLHETVPQVVPGGTLVFSPQNQGCEFEIDELTRQQMLQRRQVPPGRAVALPARAMRG